MTKVTFDHVTIATTDPDYFVNVLTNLFGFEQGQSTENLIDRGPINELFGWKGGEAKVPRTIFFREPDSDANQIEVVHMRDVTPVERNYEVPPQAVLHIGLTVDDVAGLLARAEDFGFEYISKVVRFGEEGAGFSGGFLRTQGVEFELIQHD